MRVKLLTSRVTSFDNGIPGPPQQFGDVVDVPDAEGTRLIAAKQAEIVGRGGKSIENAALSPPEKR